MLTTILVIFEVYCDLLWNAAYQLDLNKSAGQKHRKAFISHQADHFDEPDYEYEEDISNGPEEDDPSPYSVVQSSCNLTLQNLRNPPKFFLTNFGEIFQSQPSR